MRGLTGNPTDRCPPAGVGALPTLSRWSGGGNHVAVQQQNTKKTDMIRLDLLLLLFPWVKTTNTLKAAEISLWPVSSGMSVSLMLTTACWVVSSERPHYSIRIFLVRDKSIDWFQWFGFSLILWGCLIKQSTFWVFCFLFSFLVSDEFQGFFLILVFHTHQVHSFIQSFLAQTS